VADGSGGGLAARPNPAKSFRHVVQLRYFVNGSR